MTSISYKYRILKPVSIIAPLFCIAIGVPENASSMQIGKTTTAVASITLSAEHDDNIYFSSGLEGDKNQVESDILLHAIPDFLLSNTYNDHLFFFNVKSDYRYGIDSDLSDINVNTAVGTELYFPGGLSLGLSDIYSRTEFDQDIGAQAGISDNQDNVLAMNAEYTLRDFLRMQGKYNHIWKEFFEEGNSPGNEVNIDNVEGTLAIPFSTRLRGYVTGFVETQESDPESKLDYDDIKYLTGIRYIAPERFSFWLQGGYEEYDYEAENEDTSEAIGEAGFETKLSENNLLEFSLGRDGYGNLTLSGKVTQAIRDKLDITLTADKSTRKSFITAEPGVTYDVTEFGLSLTTMFLERITARLEGDYQHQESQNSFETWRAKASLDYPIQDWIKAGTHYQYAIRTADNAEQEYEDNRIGLFVTLSL